MPKSGIKNISKGRNNRKFVLCNAVAMKMITFVASTFRCTQTRCLLLDFSVNYAKGCGTMNSLVKTTIIGKDQKVF